MAGRTRLEILQEYVRTKPDNAFGMYGLAMEFRKLGRFDESVKVFGRLLAFDPLYTAAYYQAALALQEAGKPGEAEQMMSRGIAACEEKGDAHARDELLALREASRSAG